MENQETTTASLKSWILLPFNIWLYIISIPLRIIALIVFGKSKDGKVPLKLESPFEKNPYFETQQRAYYAPQPNSTKEKRYPTYVYASNQKNAPPKKQIEKPISTITTQIPEIQDRAPQSISQTFENSNLNEQKIPSFVNVENQINNSKHKKVHKKHIEKKEIQTPKENTEPTQDKEKLIQNLHQQIEELEEREKKANQEKLELELRYENESIHWKEDNENSDKEMNSLRELTNDAEKKSFDLKQKISQLRAQLHSHGDFSNEENIKSIWNVAHHEQDYTKIVEQQQYNDTHTRSYVEVAAENI